jgi:hypothetical protein
MPFVESANYLGMHYLGNIHTWIENEIISESLKKDLAIFIEKKIKTNPFFDRPNGSRIQ